MAESAALPVDGVLPREPMRQWVVSFLYPLRFLFASRPEVMGKVLGIVYCAIATHLVKKAGMTQRTAHTGAVTLIQRFGGAVKLNIHFHILFLDGVYVERPDGGVRFRWVKAPTSDEITRLTHTIARRIGRLDARHPWRTLFGRTACVLSLPANLSGARGFTPKWPQPRSHGCPKPGRHPRRDCSTDQLTRPQSAYRRAQLRT